MATIKSFTDISQSKKLAEILPLESADMYYIAKPDSTNSNMIPSDICIPRKTYLDGQAYGECCAWSLAALLDVLPDTINGTEGYYRLTIDKEGDAYNISYDNILSEESIILYAEYSLIDACVAMIEHLHERNLL